MLTRIVPAVWSTLGEVLGNKQRLYFGVHMECDFIAKGSSQFPRHRFCEWLIAVEPTTDQAPPGTFVWRFPEDQPQRLMTAIQFCTKRHHVDARDRNPFLYPLPLSW